MRLQQVLLTGCVSVVLLASIIAGGGLPYAGKFRKRSELDLRTLIPPQGVMHGWRIEILPVGQTPEVSRAVQRILDYDDVLYVAASSKGQRVSVFIAYWREGKVTPRVVASHTPDVCWVEAGWTRDLAITNGSIAIAGISLWPAQERVMSFKGEKEHLLFWHIVGDRPFSYGAQSPPWYAIFKDLAVFGTAQRNKQLFVRFSTNGGVEDLLENPVIRSMIAQLPQLRVREFGERSH